MWNNIRVSLYDLFGYFFPGAIFVIALWIFCWILVPSAAGGFTLDMSNATWLVFIFGAYLAGHFVQALSNRIFPDAVKKTGEENSKAKGEGRAKRDKSPEHLPGPLLDQVWSEVWRTFGIERDGISRGELHILCDIALYQTGKVERREMMEAREGFYRGLPVSFAVLALSLFVALFFPGKTLHMASGFIQFKWPLILVLDVISIMAVFLFHARYKRFCKYIDSEALIGFLAARRTKAKAEDCDDSE
jgi:hypothetical protein